MKKILIGLLLTVMMLYTVNADSAFGGDGWAMCNPNGNYGGWDKQSDCYVAWDPECLPVDAAVSFEKEICVLGCPESSRDATFTVGEVGKTTTQIVIDHLDGLAETDDSFQILDGDNVLCTWVDPIAGNPEVWKTFYCVVNFEGEKTLTFHPTAIDPWSQCGTYGQVAVSSIDYVTENNDIPEFTVIGATVVLGLAGLFIYRRRK